MNIFLYQIWYDDASKPAEDSGFLPFDCRNNPEFLKREVAHLIRFYDEIVRYANDDDYFALLSPKFWLKTGLTAADIKDFIQNNPCFDVYLFNPYPTHVYTHFNVWEQGESQHSGLIDLTQLLLDNAKINFDITSFHRNPVSEVVYCNYWVGSKKFLSEFVEFIRQLDNTIDSLSATNKERFFQRTTYITEATFYPFIFERMITLFLHINRSRYHSLPYHLVMPNKRYNRVERIFYINGMNRQFDHWEELQTDINALFQGFILVKNLLDPKFSFFPFEFLNRWTRSLLKYINIFRILKLKYYLMEINTN